MGKDEVEMTKKTMPIIALILSACANKSEVNLKMLVMRDYSSTGTIDVTIKFFEPLQTSGGKLISSHKLKGESDSPSVLVNFEDKLIFKAPETNLKTIPFEWIVKDGFKTYYIRESDWGLIKNQKTTWMATISSSGPTESITISHESWETSIRAFGYDDVMSHLQKLSIKQLELLLDGEVGQTNALHKLKVKNRSTYQVDSLSYRIAYKIMVEGLESDRTYEMDQRTLHFRESIAPNDSMNLEVHVHNLDFKKAKRFSYLKPTNVAIVMLEKAYLSSRKPQKNYSGK